MANLAALPKQDRAEVVRLLGFLQDYLEIVIDSYSVPRGGKTSNPEGARIIRAAQLKWQRAEKMVKKLEGVDAT